MKLVTFVHGGRASFGIVRGDGIVDVARHLPSVPDLDAAVDSAQLDVVRRYADAPIDVALGDVTIRTPLRRPGKILCIGVNYPERNQEYRDGGAEPRYPSVFVRFPSSLVADREPLVRPRESDQYDYEGELVLVVGRPGRRIAAADAWRHIVGVTIGNDGSVRDWIRHGRFNVTPGKNFDRSGSIGPWIVTLDECPDRVWRVTTRVNGEVRQDDTTDRLVFGIPELVAYLSAFCTLEAGDLIFTGTPSGAGARLQPPRYLIAGDRVDVSISDIGTLSNIVADEP